MSHRHHARNPSAGRKSLPAQPHGRSSRPTPLTKRTVSHTHSSHQQQSGPLSPRPTSSSSASVKGAGRASSKGTSEGDDEDDNNMASFLQFCATCEKQIVTPGISLLYCSEACRRRDSAKSIPWSVQHSPPLSPSTPAFYDYPPTTIIPQRSPTVLRPLSTAFSELSLCDLSSASDSESNSVDETYFALPTQPSSRPFLQRASTVEDAGTLPSLVHSPASSYGAAPPAQPMSSRPLPRKHSCTPARTIDLVTPDVSAVPPLAPAVSPKSRGARKQSAPTTDDTRRKASESSKIQPNIAVRAATPEVKRSAVGRERFRDPLW